MGKYFGTDGFRGEVNRNLTALHAFKIGQFLGYHYKENNLFIIGRDTRLSGSMLEQALAAGINSTGGVVNTVGVTTTPSIAYLTKKNKYACGIMISASHNPYFDNGIKLINSNGEKMEEDIILKIEEYLDGNINIELASKDEIGERIDTPELIYDYSSYLKSIAPCLDGLKIGLDLANGSATCCAVELFESLGAEIYVIGNEPTGTNINNNCGSTHIEGLQRLVIENKLDCGFAYDGDADRCLMVDEDGNILSGDHILYIYANYLKSKNMLTNNTVVTTVMSNIGLYKALDNNNISYAKTKVGDKYVYEYMKANNCIIGGEQSGHIIFMKDSSTGDGILTSLKMLEVMVNENKTLKELSKGLDIFPQVLINVKVQDKKATQEDPYVIASVQDVANELGTSGRILVRESGTEPLIRVMVEAKTEEVCEKLAMKVVNTIKANGFESK